MRWAASGDLGHVRLASGRLSGRPVILIDLEGRGIVIIVDERINSTRPAVQQALEARRAGPRGRGSTPVGGGGELPRREHRHPARHRGRGHHRGGRGPNAAIIDLLDTRMMLGILTGRLLLREDPGGKEHLAAYREGRLKLDVGPPAVSPPA